MVPLKKQLSLNGVIRVGHGPYKKRHLRCPFSSLHARTEEGQVKMQPEGGCPLPEERALTRHNPAGGCPDLKLVFTRAVRVKYLLFKPPHLWYFAVAARADYYKEDGMFLSHRFYNSQGTLLNRL